MTKDTKCECYKYGHFFSCPLSHQSSSETKLKPSDEGKGGAHGSNNFTFTLLHEPQESWVEEYNEKFNPLTYTDSEGNQKIPNAQFMFEAIKPFIAALLLKAREEKGTEYQEGCEYGYEAGSLSAVEEVEKWARRHASSEQTTPFEVIDDLLTKLKAMRDSTKQ